MIAKRRRKVSKTMHVLVTGVKGQLGYDVMKVLQARGIEATGADLEQFDVTDAEQTRSFIMEHRPDAVIHCSAYTAVDNAEDDRELCYRVNADGPRNIAAVCRELDAKMVYISTDYVFPGTGTKFYEPDDPVGAIGVYGETKEAGEQAVRELLDKYFIVRISWVFGYNGNNFVKTMLRLSETHSELRIVGDQIGSPTYTADLAGLLVDMALSDKYGIYHATNEGICSWADFAEEIFRQADRQVTIHRVTTEEYGAKAPRPKNSRMSKDKLVEAGFYKLPDWKDALSRYLKEIQE